MLPNRSLSDRFQQWVEDQPAATESGGTDQAAADAVVPAVAPAPSVP